MDLIICELTVYMMKEEKNKDAFGRFFMLHIKVCSSGTILKLRN